MAVAPKWRANEAQWAMLFGRTAAALELIHDFDNLSYRRIHDHLPEIWVVETDNHVFSRKTGVGVLSLNKIRDEPTIVTAAGLVELAGYAILAAKGIYRGQTNGDRMACLLKRRALWFIRQVPDSDYYEHMYLEFIRRRSSRL